MGKSQQRDGHHTRSTRTGSRSRPDLAVKVTEQTCFSHRQTEYTIALGHDFARCSALVKVHSKTAWEIECQLDLEVARAHVWSIRSVFDTPELTTLDPNAGRGFYSLVAEVAWTLDRTDAPELRVTKYVSSSLSPVCAKKAPEAQVIWAHSVLVVTEAILADLREAIL